MLIYKKSCHLADEYLHGLYIIYIILLIYTSILHTQDKIFGIWHKLSIEMSFELISCNYCHQVWL